MKSITIEVASMRQRRSHRSRRNRRFAGALLASLLPGAVALTGAAGAAEDDVEPIGVVSEAYYTTPFTASLPPVLVSEVPPGVVCIVAGIAGAAQVCGDEVQALKAELEGTPLDVSDGLPIPESPDSSIPQPVAPGTLPVGILGGQQRYASYVELELPPVPDGHQVDRFQLVLHQDPNAINVAFESPAFRDLVLGIISQISSQSPDPFVELIQGVAGGDVALLNPEPTGIEACMVVSEWDAGENQHSDDQPDIDCIFGSTGQFDAATETWTFDLTFAMAAWASGTENLGISLRPLGAENLAYGDPDLSTNFVISLAGGEAADALLPAARLVTSPIPEPIELPTFTPPPPPPAIVSNTNVFDPDPVFTAPPAPISAPEPQPAPSVFQPPAPEVELVSSDAGSAWYAWASLPFGVLVLWSFAGAVDAAPALATSRPGALTRLVAAGRGASPLS
ncbi:MAG TPA: hypothetical protein VGA13_11820 [Acidimicrobiales bacterium]